MADFKITFLGTGTSHGVPVIGCDCAVCLSSDPRDNRLRTSVYIETPECCFVVDTTPDFRQQCLRENLRRVDAVIYTHPHSDHILGFDDLRRFCEMEDRHMPIYASPGTMANLKRVFQYAFSAEGIFRTYVRPEPVEFHGEFHLGETRIVPVELPHGRCVVNGFVFYRHGRKLLAYFTDCHAVPPAALAEARDAEVLVLDALRYHAHSTHLNVETALMVSEQIAAGRTYFVHMCHDLGHEITEAKFPQGVKLSYDGLQIELG
ncbi:MAG TPA: MBL fold metallo-hydrolase [Chthoniobacterales bacterium]